jgi:hypothetical protein
MGVFFLVLWYLPACPGALRGKEVRILGYERAYARSYPKIRGLTTGIPKEPFSFIMPGTGISGKISTSRKLEEFLIFGVRSGPQTRARCTHQKSGSFKTFVVYKKILFI